MMLQIFVLIMDGRSVVRQYFAVCCILYFAHFFVRVTEARGLQMTMRRGRIYVIQSHLPSEYHTTQFNTLM